MRLVAGIEASMSENGLAAMAPYAVSLRAQLDQFKALKAQFTASKQASNVKRVDELITIVSAEVIALIRHG